MSHESDDEELSEDSDDEPETATEEDSPVKVRLFKYQSLKS